MISSISSLEHEATGAGDGPRLPKSAPSRQGSLSRSRPQSGGDKFHHDWYLMEKVLNG